MTGPYTPVGDCPHCGAPLAAATCAYCGARFVASNASIGEDYIPAGLDAFRVGVLTRSELVRSYYGGAKGLAKMDGAMTSVLIDGGSAEVAIAPIPWLVNGPPIYEGRVIATHAADPPKRRRRLR